MAVEFAAVNVRDRGGPIEAYEGLCRAAGLSTTEFADWLEVGGANAAVRRAVELVEQRREAQQSWAPRRAQLELRRRRWSTP